MSWKRGLTHRYCGLTPGVRAIFMTDLRFYMILYNTNVEDSALTCSCVKPFTKMDDTCCLGGRGTDVMSCAAVVTSSVKVDVCAVLTTSFRVEVSIVEIIFSLPGGDVCPEEFISSDGGSKLGVIENASLAEPVAVSEKDKNDHPFNKQIFVPNTQHCACRMWHR